MSTVTSASDPAASRPDSDASAPGAPVAPERVREIVTRNREALTQRPGLGRFTSTSRARLVNGLFCTIEEGEYRAVARLGRDAGGAASLPTPGMMGRAALGSCLVLSYAVWAAHLDVPLRALEVEVQSDSDSGGLYGVGDARPGYSEVRWIVTIDSPAPRDAVERMLSEAEAHCPYLDVFANPTPTRREVRWVDAGPGGET